jgi:hypothetical protein
MYIHTLGFEIRAFCLLSSHPSALAITPDLSALIILESWSLFLPIDMCSKHIPIYITPVINSFKTNFIIEYKVKHKNINICQK